MELTIFAKRRTTNEGKTFYTFLSKLKRKDGTEQIASIRFRDEAGSPKPENCPMNISVDKKDANLTTSNYVNEVTGEVSNYYTLWVSKWKEGATYVDHSLDDFE